MVVSSSTDVLARGFSEDDDDAIVSMDISVLVNVENSPFSLVTSGHRFSSLAVMKSVVDSVTFSVIIPSDSVREEESDDVGSEVLEPMLVISADKVEERSVDEDESSVISSVVDSSISLSVLPSDSVVEEESDDEEIEMLVPISVIAPDEVEERSSDDGGEDMSFVISSVVDSSMSLSVLPSDSLVEEESVDEKGELLELISVIELDEVEE